MIIFKNIRNHHGAVFDLCIPSEEVKVIDGSHFTALPAVIDPHVHFRTPGLQYKEDWLTGAQAAIRGGCTQVFDMPNTLPPTITAQLLKEKMALIDQQLREVRIPLRYRLYIGADESHLAEISKVKQDVVGIKIFMGCSTGNLVMDSDESLAAVFSIAAKENMLVAVHAEDEKLIQTRKREYTGVMNYAAHSVIRDIEVACRAVEKAIGLSRLYGTRLYILHVSSQEEIALIKAAKQEGLPVFAETTPHHLFLDSSHYASLGGKAVVNPPLRDPSHHAALFAAIHDKTIDTIGSDHAPHTPDEKTKPYGECPSGMPGIEFMLPLLLNAHHQGLLSLEEIVNLTSERARAIFQLPHYNDWVIVDLNKKITVTRTVSKCGFTPYLGYQFYGMPVYTVLADRCFEIKW